MNAAKKSVRFERKAAVEEIASIGGVIHTDAGLGGADVRRDLHPPEVQEFMRRHESPKMFLDHEEALTHDHFVKSLDVIADEDEDVAESEARRTVTFGPRGGECFWHITDSCLENARLCEESFRLAALLQNEFAVYIYIYIYM